MSVRSKALMTAAVVASLALAGGVAAQFGTSTSSEQQQAGTGQMSLTIDNIGSGLAAPITDAAPGDSVQRFFNLRNSGSLAISSVVASQSNTLGALLLKPSDITVKLDACSVAWNTSDGTCTGVASTVLPTISLADWTGQLNLAGFGALEAGQSKYLKAVTSLSKDAPNTVQDKSGDLSYTFIATQRAGSADVLTAPKPNIVTNGGAETTRVDADRIAESSSIITAVTTDAHSGTSSWKVTPAIATGSYGYVHYAPAGNTNAVVSGTAAIASAWIKAPSGSQISVSGRGVSTSGGSTKVGLGQQTYTATGQWQHVSTSWILTDGNYRPALDITTNVSAAPLLIDDVMINRG